MSEALTHGAGQDLLKAWKRAWEARDVDAFVALFREDADFRPDPFEEAFVGAVAIRGYWNDFAARTVHTELDAERIWVVDRSVLASWHGATTLRRTAERTRQRGFLAFDLDPAGLIARLRGWPGERIVGIDRTFRAEPAPDGVEERS
ncbi:MAG: nuclear transport factor 2 family protein [Chloroflexota bacterium]